MDTKTTEAQKRAKQKYMEKYVEVKVRMTPDRREIIKEHANKHDNGSSTAFINRAIDGQISRDTGADDGKPLDGLAFNQQMEILQERHYSAMKVTNTIANQIKELTDAEKKRLKEQEKRTRKRKDG